MRSFESLDSIANQLAAGPGPKSRQPQRPGEPVCRHARAPPPGAAGRNLRGTAPGGGDAGFESLFATPAPAASAAPIAVPGIDPSLFAVPVGARGDRGPAGARAARGTGVGRIAFRPARRRVRRDCRGARHLRGARADFRRTRTRRAAGFSRGGSGRAAPIQTRGGGISVPRACAATASQAPRCRTRSNRFSFRAPPRLYAEIAAAPVTFEEPEPRSSSNGTRRAAGFVEAVPVDAATIRTRGDGTGV